MRVLYVVGACLTKNTSANMSHNAYVQGLIENGCEVDIIMAEDSWGEQDKALPRWKEVNYYEYNSQSFVDKLRKKATSTVFNNSKEFINETVKDLKIDNGVNNRKISIRDIVKKLFYTLFPVDPIYPLEKVWLKEALKFGSEKSYDLVISNSSPAASHKLVVLLRDKKRIEFKRWVQIWEDPWYFDLYGGHTEQIKEEEHYLLSEANEIYYVSPLTLEYQKKYYTDCALKMKCIPLPFLEYENKEKNFKVEENSLGYFGDYYSKTRNLLPFYNAMIKLNKKGVICGDSDLRLEKTDNMEISERVTLDKLSLIQNNTGVLVHLCNLKGGQIPGKIYHYSATDKPILFILDGTEEEQQIIQKFFGKFNRYYFCKNNERDIEKAIVTITKNYDKYSGRKVVDFEPKNVVKLFLKKEYQEEIW